MTTENIKQIIHKSEVRRLEFKAQLPTSSEIAKTVVAFVNDAGSDIFVGVVDVQKS